MSLISSIFGGAMKLRADAGGTPAPWDDYWYHPIGGSSAAGIRVSPEASKRLSTVFACVMKKATAIAMLPCKIYTDDGSGGKKVATNHPVYDVLYSQPNHLQTAFEFKQQMEGWIELRGNAYAEIIPGPRGAVDQLMPMHPDRVRVEQLQGSGRLRYRYNDPLTNTERVLMQDEVFHVREFPDQIGVGQSRISLACDTFGVALAQQDYTAKFLKNDATPRFLLTGTNFRTKEDEETFREQWQDAQTGPNRHKAALLPPGIDVKTLSVSPLDAQLLESTKASDVRICTIFNILPHLVGVDAGKSATYASVEQFNLMHAVQCVLPMAIMWEQAIQRDLILSDKYYVKFSLASLLRGDTKTRFEAYNQAIAAGWMCPDDARALEDINPIPGGAGKKFWRPLNWAPLDQVDPPATAKLVGDAQDDDEDLDDDQSDEDGSGDTDQEQAHGWMSRIDANLAEIARLSMEGAR